MQITIHIVKQTLTLFGLDRLDSDDSVEYPVSCMTPVMDPNSLSTVNKDDWGPLDPCRSSILEKILDIQQKFPLWIPLLARTVLWPWADFGVRSKHSGEEHKLSITFVKHGQTGNKDRNLFGPRNIGSLIFYCFILNLKLLWGEI